MFGKDWLENGPGSLMWGAEGGGGGGGGVVGGGGRAAIV